MQDAAGSKLGECSRQESGEPHGLIKANAHLPPEEDAEVCGDQADRDERKAAAPGVVGKRNQLSALIADERACGQSAR